MKISGEGERWSSKQGKHSIRPISVKITGWPLNYTGTKEIKGPRLEGSILEQNKEQWYQLFLTTGKSKSGAWVQAN